MDVQFGRIRFICGDNGGKYPFNHSLYLEGDNARVIIDPACSLQKLSELKQKGGVDEVWLSHWHEDHMRYINLFADCPLRISKRDFPPLTDINIFLDWYGLKEGIFRELWEKEMLENFNYQPKKKAHFIKDEETINLGSMEIQVIPTPGHTPGHLSFYFPDEEILFLGDYDLTSFGPWYGDVYSSIDQTIASIHILKNIPARTWIASHNTGLFLENPVTLWNNYEEVIYQREDRILNYLNKPKTIDEIVSAWLIYGKPREPKEFFEFSERALIGKHIEHLEGQGKIIPAKDKYLKV